MSDVNKKMIIIISYLCVIGIQFFYSIALKGIEASYSYLLILVVYSTLAFFTYKGNNIATWIIIVSVLLSGVGTILMGVFFVTVDQLAMKVVFILLGLYFIYGGSKLLSITHKGKESASKAG